MELAGCEPDQDLFPGCFVFADWAINAWLYAIQLQGDLGVVGRIFLVEVNGHRAAPIASSFGEWVALFSGNPELLVPGNALIEAVPQANAKRSPWWRFDWGPVDGGLDTNHPYRWRTWWRTKLPYWLLNLGAAGKGEDCEAAGGWHRWYNQDGKSSGCYHCGVVRGGRLWEDPRHN